MCDVVRMSSCPQDPFKGSDTNYGYFIQITIFETRDQRVVLSQSDAVSVCVVDRECAELGTRHALSSNDTPVDTYLHGLKGKKKLLRHMEVRKRILLYLLSDRQTDISGTR